MFNENTLREMIENTTEAILRTNIKEEKERLEKDITKMYKALAELKK